MKHQLKSNSEQRHEHDAERQAEQNCLREFATVEELLRFDAAHTEVPGGIAQRLQKSTGAATAEKPTWWRRILGGNYE